MTADAVTWLSSFVMKPQRDTLRGIELHQMFLLKLLENNQTAH